MVGWVGEKTVPFCGVSRFVVWPVIEVASYSRSVKDSNGAENDANVVST